MVKKLYKSFMVVTTFNILTRLMSFIFHIFLSRRLGAENLGVFQIASAMLFMFMCFSSSGFPVTLSRKIAHYDAIGDYNRSDSMLTSTLIITATLSTIISAFFYMFPSVLGALFTNPKCHTVFKLLLPALISGSLYSTIRAWFWGKKKYLAYSMIELVAEVLLIITVCVLISIGVYSDSEYNTLALAHSIADVICVVILIIAFIIIGGKMSKPKHFQELATASAPITTTRIMTALISSMTALLLPSLLVKGGLDISTATAEYGRMSGMVMPIILAPGTIVSSLIIVMVPELAGKVSKHGMQSIHNNIKMSLLFSTAIAGLFMAIFLACGKDIAELLYHDERVGGMIVYSALIIVPLVLNQMLTSFLNTLGKENWTFMVCIISSIGLVLTIGFGAPTLMIYAYPLGLAIYHLTGLVLNSIRIITLTGMSSRYTLLILVITISSLAIAGIVTLISGSYSEIHIIGRLAISCIIVATLFASIIVPIASRLRKEKSVK